MSATPIKFEPRSRKKAAGGGAPAGDQEAPPTGYGEGPGPCPVVPLGHKDGRYAFLSPSGQLRVLKDGAISKQTIRGLFETKINWLWQRWPVMDRDGNRVGWSVNSANEFLVREAAQQGLFDPFTDMRGPGPWLEEGDEKTPDHLIVHCGDRVWVNLPEDQGGGWSSPGRYGKYVYPSYKPEPKPGDRSATVREIRDMVQLFDCWNWSVMNPNSPPLMGVGEGVSVHRNAVLLAGWLGAARVCGALEWRPSLWISGDRATGKTTLQDAINRVLGSSILKVADTSEAGVRQALRGATRPVALDEFEAEEVQTKALQVIKLIRIASKRNTGSIVRGSAEGQVNMYNIDAVFLCSSILRPSMTPADMQRLTLLDLEELEADAQKVNEVKTRIRGLATLGPKLFRRMVNRWDDMQATFLMYQQALIRMDHSSRSADQIGTLLACADVLLFDGECDARRVTQWAAMFDAEEIAEVGGDEPDNIQCLNYLLTSVPDTWSGGYRQPIAKVIEKAVTDASYLDQLNSIGLDIRENAAGVRCLAISNTHQQIATIYKGSHWGTFSGRSGGWVQSLKRLPGVVKRCPNVRFSMAASTKAVMVPLEHLGLGPAPVPPLEGEDAFALREDPDA